MVRAHRSQCVVYSAFAGGLVFVWIVARRLVWLYPAPSPASLTCNRWTVTRTRLLLIVSGLVIGLTLLFGSAGMLIWRFMQPSPGPIDAEIDSSLPDNDIDVIESPAVPTPQRGGTFVQAVGRNPVTFNPVYATDPASQAVIDLIYPRLVGQDPQGGFIVPSEVAERWEISPDGRTYTFTLREGVRWSDGQPVVAEDFKFTYDALASPVVQSPYRDRTMGIQRIDAPDPRTVEVTLRGPNCAVLYSLRRPLLPSHRYAADFSDLATNPLNQTPEVSAGPFVLADRSQDQIVLARNEAYWRGAPLLDEWIVRIIPDPDAREQALAAGLIDLAAFSPSDLLRMTPAQLPGVTQVEYPTDGYNFVAVNLADPSNPQAGRNGDGTRQPQTPHPILGDLAVRQAIAAAVDYPSLLETVYSNHAYRLGSYVPPSVGWVATDVPLPAYDPEQARQLLESAGWVDANGDGVREQGARLLRLTLQTNEDNPLRMRIAETIAADLAEVGFQIDLQVISFEALTAALLGQRYDLVVIGWESLGADPGNSPFWHSRDDVPGNGFNFTSVNDPEIDTWFDSAAQAPGCDLNQRAELYRQIQQRIATLSPYILLAGQTGVWAYQDAWQGIAPGPWSITYNVESWWGAP